MCQSAPHQQCGKPFFSNTRQNGEWTETSTRQNEIELANVWRVTFFFNSPTNTKYRILRTIGRYFFPSTRWLRPIVHIDLYKDEVKKIWNPSKKSR